MRRSTIVALVLVLGLGIAVPTLAGGGEQGDLELGVYGGYAFPDDYGAAGSALYPDDDTLIGARLGMFVTSKWGFEFSAQSFSTQLRGAPATDFDIDSLRLNLLRNFRAGESFRPFVTFGLGNEALKVGSIDDDNTAVNVGGGLRWYFGRNFGIRVDQRLVFTDVRAVDERQTNLETAVGLLVSFGGKRPGDADGDGVDDRRDRCPDTPRGATVDDRGCPQDGDGDGVYDGLDGCPGTASGVPVDAGGCALDTDGDGVHDGLDRCPATPRGATVDAWGCPSDADGDGVWNGLDRCADTPRGATVDASGCPKDGDRDGVWDGLDRCPGTPAGVAVDATGCSRDADGDGVDDAADRCPNTPKGTRVDARGCTELFTETTRKLVLEGVTFEYDSARLNPAATVILDQVAATLKEWPEINVEVGGHTDAKGADAYNQDLSRRRAESVRDYLAGKGVGAQRLTARGYGEEQPVGDNATAEGRAANRRVELKRLN